MVWPILIGSAVGKVSIFVDQVLGSLLGAGSISGLNYAEKLFQLPLGLFVAGITVPIFPLLSEHVAAKQPERVKATLNFAMRLMGFVMIPATVGLIVLRTPLIGLLFQHGKFTADDTARTAWALLFFCLGLYSYAGRDTLTRVFYAYHDTRTPVKISVATVGINIVCSYLFMHVLGVGGLALGHDHRPHRQLRGADRVVAAQDRPDGLSGRHVVLRPRAGGIGGHGGGRLGSGRAAGPVGPGGDGGRGRALVRRHRRGCRGVRGRSGCRPLSRARGGHGHASGDGAPASLAYRGGAVGRWQIGAAGVAAV